MVTSQKGGCCKRRMFTQKPPQTGFSEEQVVWSTMQQNVFLKLLTPYKGSSWQVPPFWILLPKIHTLAHAATSFALIALQSLYSNRSRRSPLTISKFNTLILHLDLKKKNQCLAQLNYRTHLLAWSLQCFVQRKSKVTWMGLLMHLTRDWFSLTPHWQLSEARGSQ